MSSLSARLRDHVTLEASTRTPDGQGGFTDAWAPLPAGASIAAEVIGLSGGEALKAGVERNVQQWRATIRRRDDVRATMRLQWHRTAAAGGDLRLEIKAAMPDPKDPRAATLLVCESGF